MLRRLSVRRGTHQPGEASIALPLIPVPSVTEQETLAPTLPVSEAQAEAVALAIATTAVPQHRRFTKKRIAFGITLVFIAAAGAGYTQKDKYSDDAADLSRKIIGDENTARVESWYFAAKDRADRLKYRVFGGDTNPFDQAPAVVQYVDKQPGRTILVDLSRPRDTSQLSIPNLFKTRPMELPKTVALRDSLEAGEGVWTTAGLPRSSPTDMLMAKTFIRPDKARPYASVGVLLVDSRRIRLKMTGGTIDPGGDRGVKGPGVIPAADLKDLLMAWNGGFKGPHGGFGMVADGKEYRPLRNGLASVAVLKDGTVRMGEWGKTLTWNEEMVSVRQNAVLLVDNCEVSKRTQEGNDTWGYVEVNSADFITWRSAIGLTKDGNMMVAAGNSLSAATLAQALWAAGACTAMQLDINSPYVLTSLYFPQPDGTAKPEKFMDSMPDSATRFAKAQERDFFYMTVDDSRYRR